MAVLMTTMRRSLFGDKMSWLLMGCVALLVSGVTLNSGTTAFFTDTQTVTSNSFTTASVALAGSPFTAFNFTKVVPGDVMWRPVTVTNNSNVAVPYFMSIKEDTASNYSSANGLLVVAVRCFDSTLGTGNNVACDSAAGTIQSVSTITGVMGSTQNINLNTGLTLGAQTNVKVNSAGSAILQINNTDITGVRIQTADNATCVTSGAGACLMGGPSTATTVSSPAISSVTLYGAVTAGIPVESSVVGLAASAVDRIGLLVYLPTTTTASQVPSNTATTYTVAFTGVQPNGTTTSATGATAIHS